MPGFFVSTLLQVVHCAAGSAAPPCKAVPAPIPGPALALGFFISAPARGTETMKMPDKPDTWAAGLAWLIQHAPIIYASLLSWAMAMARIIYGGGTRRQALLEGALCGGLALTIISGFEFFGVPQSMATFIGGWIGFLGVEKIRDLADRYAGIKLPRRGSGE